MTSATGPPGTPATQPAWKVGGATVLCFVALLLGLPPGIFL